MKEMRDMESGVVDYGMRGGWVRGFGISKTTRGGASEF
jgi:hypothetical protein